MLAFDIDPAAAEQHYRALRGEGRTDVLPLVLDVANPSPGLGWAGHERRSLLERADADVVLALALVHHLAISRNVPLPMLLGLFADLAPWAIVEFVPREDPMVRRLLASRRDVFDDYTLDGFRDAAGERFEVVREEPIAESPRTLFLLPALIVHRSTPNRSAHVDDSRPARLRDEDSSGRRGRSASKYALNTSGAC